MFAALARDWVASPEQTLMTLLLFRREGQRMYPDGYDSVSTPAYACRYLKAAKLIDSDEMKFWCEMMSAVEQQRQLQSQ